MKVASVLPKRRSAWMARFMFSAPGMLKKPYPHV
jgi:hypothetical protein